MENEIMGQLEKLSPLTLMILGIAYTIGKAMSTDLKESKKSLDDIEKKIEDLKREVQDMKEESRRYDKKKTDQ